MLCLKKEKPPTEKTPGPEATESAMCAKHTNYVQAGFSPGAQCRFNVRKSL